MDIEAYLEANGLSQRDFAQLVGCTRQTVYNWLAGGAVDQRFWPALDELGVTFTRCYTAQVVAVPVGSDRTQYQFKGVGGGPVVVTP